jgi:hypothetical protein
MVAWLARLLRRDSGQIAMPDDTGTSAVTQPTRFSVWEQMAADPGVAALRAQWEARWDEF